jgi:hypothetical protein
MEFHRRRWRDPRALIDTSSVVPHASHVLAFSRRLSALALAVLISVGNAAVCAASVSTAEARMACCAKGDACPTHKGVSHGHDSGFHRGMTQAQADRCCAASERDSNQTSPPFVIAISSTVLGPGVVVPVTAPRFVLSNAWRTGAPIPLASIPRHVLLSVFLV